MCVFLACILLISSVALKNYEKTPVYETPEIVKSNQLTGSRHTAFAMNADKMVKLFCKIKKTLAKAQGFAGSKQAFRNNLIRGFTIDRCKIFILIIKLSQKFFI